MPKYGDHRKYSSLVKQLPLDTPLSVMIDPSNACNFKCVFCPTGDPELLDQAGRNLKVMSLSTFTIITRQLEAFPCPIPVVHLYKDGEPLANKDLPNMIRKLKEAELAERVETTSNGGLLTREMARQLCAAGLDAIRFSIYGTTEQEMVDTARGHATLAEIMENIAFLASHRDAHNYPLHIHCKIVDADLSKEQKIRFREMFNPICDSLEVTPLMDWPGAGTTMVDEVSRRVVCPEPFMKLAINSNGDVGVCCVDWSHHPDLLLGNVNDCSLKSMWEGKRLQTIRKLHLGSLRGKLAPCASCDYMQGVRDSADLDGAVVRLQEVYK